MSSFAEMFSALPSDLQREVWKNVYSFSVNEIEQRRYQRCADCCRTSFGSVAFEKYSEDNMMFGQVELWSHNVPQLPNGLVSTVDQTDLFVCKSCFDRREKEFYENDRNSSHLPGWAPSDLMFNRNPEWEEVRPNFPQVLKVNDRRIDIEYLEPLAEDIDLDEDFEQDIFDEDMMFGM